MGAPENDWRSLQTPSYITRGALRMVWGACWSCKTSTWNSRSPCEIRSFLTWSFRVYPSGMSRVC